MECAHGIWCRAFMAKNIDSCWGLTTGLGHTQPHGQGKVYIYIYICNSLQCMSRGHLLHHMCFLRLVISDMAILSLCCDTYHILCAHTLRHDVPCSSHTLLPPFATTTGHREQDTHTNTQTNRYVPNRSWTNPSLPTVLTYKSTYFNALY
jgi:hypothetical protein